MSPAFLAYRHARYRSASGGGWTRPAAGRPPRDADAAPAGRGRNDAAPAGRGQTGRAPQPGCRARCAVLYDARDRCVTGRSPWAPHTDSWGWAQLLWLNRGKRKLESRAQHAPAHLCLPPARLLMLEVLLGELDAATRIEVVKRGHAHAAHHALESHGAESPQARSAAALAAVARGDTPRAPAVNVAAVAAAGGGRSTARTTRTRCWHTRTACIRCSPVPGCGIPARGLGRSGA